MSTKEASRVFYAQVFLKRVSALQFVKIISLYSFEYREIEYRVFIIRL